MRRVAMAIAAALLGACARGGEEGIRATGTVEVVETDVAAMIPARVVEVRVREGDSVRAGQVLATLTQSTIPADVAGHEARLAAAQAALRDLAAGSRPAEVGAAEAEVRGAEAEAARTGRDLSRYRRLEAAGALSRQALDAAVSAAEVAAGRREAARAQLRLVREGARPERVSAARAEVEAARAALQAARATQADLVLAAPSDGVVTARLAEPGEVVPAGRPVVTVGQTARPWVRVYVGERDVPRVRVGQAVTAVLDGMEERRFAGRVVAIRDRAEYTPRVALTEDERADLVFGVKVELDDRSGTVKAGLPATVTFSGEPRRTP